MDKFLEELTLSQNSHDHERYNNFCDNIHKWIFELVKSSNNEDNIFHYTNANSLQNIITNKSLWVTKSDFLNDKTEYKYAINLINNVTEKYNYNNLESCTIYNLKNEVKANLRRSFIFSLSTNCDSVNLWANYSKYDGYNIEFNSEKLHHKIHNGEICVLGNDIDKNHNPQKYKVDRIDEHDGSVKFYHGKVIYDEKKQLEVIKDTFNHLDKLYLDYHNFSKELDVIDEINLTEKTYEFTHIVAGILSGYVQLFKNKVFELDQEYRLLFNIKSKTNAIKYRTFNGVFIPYIDVRFEEDLNHYKGLPIKGITVGPKNNLDIAQKGLKSFLGSQGYHFKNNDNDIYVKKSDIPLRY